MCVWHVVLLGGIVAMVGVRDWHRLRSNHAATAQRTAAPLACPLPPLPAGPPILPMFACHVQPELAGKITGMLLELDNIGEMLTVWPSTLQACCSRPAGKRQEAMWQLLLR